MNGALQYESVLSLLAVGDGVESGDAILVARETVVALRELDPETVRNYHRLGEI